MQSIVSKALYAPIRRQMCWKISTKWITIQAKQRVGGVAARGQESLAGFAKQFAIGKEEVDHMLVSIIIFDIM